MLIPLEELEANATSFQPTIELTVVLKDSERSYRHKFLLYNQLIMHPNCKEIQSCINEAMESFKADPEDIIIQTKMVVQ